MKTKKLLSLLVGFVFLGVMGCSDSGSDKPAEITQLTQAEIALAQLCDAAPVIEITTPALTCQAPNCYAAIGAKGGTGSYQIAVDGLEGLSVNNGVIQGNAATGARTLNVTVTDSNCLDKQATGQVALAIAAPTAPPPPPPAGPCGAPGDLTFSPLNPFSEYLCLTPNVCTWNFVINGGSGPFTIVQPGAPDWLTASVVDRVVTVKAKTDGVAPTSHGATVRVTDTSCPQRQNNFSFTAYVGGLNRIPPFVGGLDLVDKLKIPVPQPPPSCGVDDARVTFVTANYGYAGTGATIHVKFCDDGNNCKSHRIKDFEGDQLEGGRKETYILSTDVTTGFSPFNCKFLKKIRLVASERDDDDGWIIEGVRVDAKIDGTFTRADGSRAQPITANSQWTAIYNNPSVFSSIRNHIGRNSVDFMPNDTAVGIVIKTPSAEDAGTDSNIRLVLKKKGGFTADADFTTFINTFEGGVPHWESEGSVLKRVLDWNTDDQNDFEQGDTDWYGGYFPNSDPVEHKYKITFDNSGGDPGWYPDFFKVAFIRPGSKEFLEDRKCDGELTQIDEWFGSSNRNWPHDFGFRPDTSEYYTPQANVECIFPPITLCASGERICGAHD